MALSDSTSDNNIGIKVNGDLSEFQIIEERSDSEDDDDKNCDSRTVDTLPSLPSQLVKPSSPVYGSVSVNNSENVHFGNNTYFNGPVTIKQVVQSSSGFDNSSYIHTEDENSQSPHTNESKNNSEIKTFQIHLWHKLTFSAICIIAIGGVCAIISIVVSSSGGQDSSSTNFNDEDSTNDPLLIAPNHLRIVPRSDWLAQPVENQLDQIKQPVPWVVITHTATESCSIQSECVLRVRVIQMFHIESKKWYDIGYNFLVAGDGSAYYGRGWDYIGAHTLGYNRYSIGIAFVGTFNNEPPPKKQLEACEKLLRLGVEQGKLSKDYKLFGHRQLASTLSPGDKLFDIIKEWPHFVNNLTDIKELLPNY